MNWSNWINAMPQDRRCGSFGSIFAREIARQKYGENKSKTLAQWAYRGL